jgi:hypothetical protein
VAVQAKQVTKHKHKRNNIKNTVQKIQNTVNTSTQITRTNTQYKTHTYTNPQTTKTHIYTHSHITKQAKITTVQVTTTTVQDIFFFFFFSGCAAQRGLWPPRPRGFLITHNEASQSVGLLWTSDHLVAETST